MGGEPFVENGCEAVNHLTEKYWDRGYDAVTRKLGITPKLNWGGKSVVERDKKSFKQKSVKSEQRSGKKENTAPRTRSPDDLISGKERRSRHNTSRHPSSSADSIASWDRERYFEEVKSAQQGEQDSSLDRQSEHSDKVIRAYHLDPSDPARTPGDVWTLNTLSNSSLLNPRGDRDMSQYNQNGSLAPGQYQQGRSNSAQPPRTRGYYDDEEEYGSDYDDRRGSRYQTSGRGYDDRGYDDRGYDDGRGDYREEVVTERYRGVSQALVVRASSLTS